MTIADQTVHSLLHSLAAKEPTPGGGAVAGILAALSTSLGNMVIVYSKGNESLQAHNVLHDDCNRFLQSAMDEALILGDADADAYEKVSALWKLPKDDPARVANWDEALTEAIEIPIKTMQLSCRILITLEQLVGTSNNMLKSDLGIAAILSEAAARAAAWNVDINAMQIEDADKRKSLQDEASSILAECIEKTAIIENSCRV